MVPSVRVKCRRGEKASILYQDDFSRAISRHIGKDPTPARKPPICSRIKLKTVSRLGEAMWQSATRTTRTSGHISYRVRYQIPSARRLPIAVVAAPIIMVADPNGVLTQLIHHFLGIEAQTPIISLRIFVIAETLTVVDPGELSARETQISRRVWIAHRQGGCRHRHRALGPGVVGNLEHARRTRSFIEIVVPPGAGGVDQPRGRNRTVVTQHPISGTVSDLAESGVAGTCQEHGVVCSPVR